VGTMEVVEPVITHTKKGMESCPKGEPKSCGTTNGGTGALTGGLVTGKTKGGELKETRERWVPPRDIKVERIRKTMKRGTLWRNFCKGTRRKSRVFGLEEGQRRPATAGGSPAQQGPGM